MPTQVLWCGTMLRLARDLSFIPTFTPPLALPSPSKRLLSLCIPDVSKASALNSLPPSSPAGVVVWEDSALVRAVREGRVLCVDEADKAPVEVVCVLKVGVVCGRTT